MVISLKTMLDHFDTGMNQQQIIVFVRSPVIHYTWDNGGNYTSYAIHIETNHIAFSLERSVVRRRYSEFVYMRNLIKSQHPTIIPPSLPPRSIFTNKSDSEFIEKRRQGLEAFLIKIMEEAMYVSNRTVHLFVQSSHPMHKIAHMVGCDHNPSDEIEPHLTLTHLFPDEDHFTHGGGYAADVPDFDILERLRSNDPSSTSLSNAVCTHCGLPRSQSRVSQGSLIIYPSLRLRSPTCDGHAMGNESSELDNSFATVSLSNSTLNVPNSLSDCSVASDNLHIPKKKVSFSGEVTVAQILGQDSD